MGKYSSDFSCSTSTYILYQICFALLLWEEGGNIDFMLTSDFYVMLQSPSEMPERWERMSNYDFLFMAGSQDVKR